MRGFHPDRVQYDHPDQPDRLKIYRPSTNRGGITENWTRWEGGAIAGLSGFVHAILVTIQNWSDNDQSRVPGYRDRIVHVSFVPLSRLESLGGCREPLAYFGGGGTRQVVMPLSLVRTPKSPVPVMWTSTAPA